MNHSNATTTKPSTLGMQPSFGFGDRIGCATPGHVEAMKHCGGEIAPIFPQQSIREMTRTARTPEQVMYDAINGVVQAGWEKPFGADADHLKTREDVDRTAAAGFTFFTIDPSGFVDQQADNYDAKTIESKFDAIRSSIGWFNQYRNQVVRLANGTSIELNDLACKRAAVKYGAAIAHAIELSTYIAQVHESLGRDFEIEISVDETDQPTTLAEHYIIAHQCLLGEMKLISLAPRFLGDFEKGVDYRGDLTLLTQSLADHAEIAKTLGPYKLSLHSGSDKLSMYGLLSKATHGAYHVKTAGTSYLEALRVIAQHDPSSFRELIDFSRSRYETDRATYHVSATLRSAPSPADATDAQLVSEYLGNWSDVPNGQGFRNLGRQILHCTFGTVLTHEVFGSRIRQCLNSHRESYTEILSEHFSRHLKALSKHTL